MNMLGMKKGENPSIVGIVTNPVDQFEKIKQRPLIICAFVIVLGLTIVGTWLANSGANITGFEGSIDDTQIGINRAIMLIGSIFGLIFAIFIPSVLYLLIAKIIQSEVTFRQIVSMNTYIMVISGISMILNGLTIYLIGGNLDTLHTSLGSLVPSEGVMIGFWSSIEIFTIWITILSAIGLQKVAGFSRLLAWVISIVFFMIGVLLMVGSTAINIMVGV